MNKDSQPANKQIPSGRPHSAAASIVHGSQISATLPLISPKELLHSQPYYPHVPLPHAMTGEQQ